jgi:hypothetical protein
MLDGRFTCCSQFPTYPAQIAEDLQKNDISCYKLPTAASPDEADEASRANEVLQVWLTRSRFNLLFFFCVF